MPIPYQPSTYNTAMNIAHSEGVKALYYGVSATLLQQLLYSSTLMGLYNHLKDKWTMGILRGAISHTHAFSIFHKIDGCYF